MVPADPLDDDPAHLLAERPAWASLADGDSTYIRIRRGDRDEEGLFDLRSDARQLHNLATEPDRQSLLDRMRKTLDQMTAGPLTPGRFRP